MKKNDRHPSRIRAGIRGVLLLVCILLLAAALIPNFISPRTHTARNACIANLKQIEGAKATWALEHKKELTDTPLPSNLYGPTNYIREAPFCPQGGIYTIGSVGEKPMCSLSGPVHSL